MFEKIIVIVVTKVIDLAVYALKKSIHYEFAKKLEKENGASKEDEAVERTELPLNQAKE